MLGLRDLSVERGMHPVDMIEAVADHHDWMFERMTEDEITIRAPGIWAEYNVSFSWMENFEALHMACQFDLRVPEARIVETYRLLSMVNEKMLVGHFDLWVADNCVVFRHTTPLAGGAEANDAQIEYVMDEAVRACERYYQAFHFVCWGARDARGALDSVCFDTVGEA